MLYAEDLGTMRWSNDRKHAAIIVRTLFLSCGTIKKYILLTQSMLSVLKLMIIYAISNLFAKKNLYLFWRFLYC